MSPRLHLIVRQLNILQLAKAKGTSSDRQKSSCLQAIKYFSQAASLNIQLSVLSLGMRV